MRKTHTSHLPGHLDLETIIEQKAATVYFYGNFVVVEVNEGVTLSYRTGFSLLIKGLSILKRKPWIYISNRVNSYAVNPTDYKYLNKVPTLKGLVIVDRSTVGKKNASLEANFSDKPFMVVDTMEAAYQWGKALLEKNSSKNT
ncbi:MAG: hypothetical protein AAFP76_06380 [Bacteroidota bacterium]